MDVNNSVKIQAFVFLTIVVFFSSCSSNAEKSVRVEKPIVESLRRPSLNNAANGSRVKDTIFITGNSAVSFWLDSAEMERRRKKEGDDFSTGADDAAEYSAKADSFLRKQNLMIVQADGSKYLKFLQNNGAFTFIKTDTLPFLHTMYFFDPIKKPYNADITIIEDEYKKFFR